MYREPDGERIFRSECQFCFEQKITQEGLFLCLSCDTCVCKDHISMHNKKQGHTEFVKLLYKTKEEVSYLQLSERLKKQTIEEVTELEQQIIELIEDQIVCIDEPNDEQCVSAALITDCPANEQYRYMRATAAPAQPIIGSCCHMNIIPEIKQKHPQKQICCKCDLQQNLWMCLSCGALSCGRKNWDGTGGNGHALEHSKQTGHPAVIRITSACKSVQELYCYECDDSITLNEQNKPILKRLLQQFDIDYVLERGTAAEISLEEQVKATQLKAQKEQRSSEMSLDQRVTDQLQLLPLENTGNTCYANAAFNCLIAMGIIRATGHVDTCTNDAHQCFACQLSRLTWYLNRPKTVVKCQPHLTALLLAMGSYLTNAENVGRQQDAQEFVQLFLKRVGNPFVVRQTRKEMHCALCGFVQYTEGPQLDSLTLTCNFFDTVSDAEAGMPVDLVTALAADIKGTQKPVFNFKCRQCGIANTEGQEPTLRVGVSAVGALPQQVMVVANRLFYDKAQQKVVKLRTRLQNALCVDFSNIFAENPQDSEAMTMASKNSNRKEARAALKYSGGDAKRAMDVLGAGLIKTDQSDDIHAELEAMGAKRPTEQRYILKAFVEHIGQSYDCGHYVAYCNTQLGWIKCNDEKMSVIGEHDLPTEQAYIMFYEKK